MTRVHVSREPIRLTCPEFLCAAIVRTPEAAHFHNAERLTKILARATPDGKTRWYTATRQSSFGESNVFLHPIIIVMDGDYDGHTFVRRDGARHDDSIDPNWAWGRVLP